MMAVVAEAARSSIPASTAPRKRERRQAAPMLSSVATARRATSSPATTAYRLPIPAAMARPQRAPLMPAAPMSSAAPVAKVAIT